MEVSVNLHSTRYFEGQPVYLVQLPIFLGPWVPNVLLTLEHYLNFWFVHSIFNSGGWSYELALALVLPSHSVLAPSQWRCQQACTHRWSCSEAWTLCVPLTTSIFSTHIWSLERTNEVRVHCIKPAFLHRSIFFSQCNSLGIIKAQMQKSWSNVWGFFWNPCHDYGCPQLVSLQVWRTEVAPSFHTPLFPH